MQQNEAVFAKQYIRLKEEFKSFPKGTISRKVRKNRIEYYRQIVQPDGRRKEIYIRKADLPEVLARFERKKQVKKQLREMDHQLREMPAPQRKRFRAAIALGRDWDIIHAHQNEQRIEQQEAVSPNTIHAPAEVFMNGLRVRSRAELSCLGIAAVFNMQIRYEPPIETIEQFIRRESPYIADFLITSPVTGRRYCWEHLGHLDDPEYKKHQRRKMKDYRREGYYLGKNLIVTTSYKHVNEQMILWELIRAGALDPCTVRRKLRLLMSRISQWPGKDRIPLKES